MACGADDLGTTLLTSLASDVAVTVPNVPLTGDKFSGTTSEKILAPVVKLTSADLTTGFIDGAGTFDKLMTGISAHLKNEYDKNRITGAEYTKAFIAAVQLALSEGSAFLLSTNKQYWDTLVTQQQAELALVQVATSRVQLETAKVQHVAAQLQTQNLLADYAIKKLQLSKLSSEFCISEYTLANILPKQALLLSEQYEAARAQTKDTRSDGAAVAGNLGAQKSLHAQQVASYIQDSKLKVGKIFSDTWITQKTLNEGIDVPDAFNNLSVQSAMTALRASVGI